VIGFLARGRSNFFKIIRIGKFEEMQNCVKRSTLLHKGFIEKKCFTLRVFFNRVSIICPSNESNLALSDNEKEIIVNALAKTQNNKSEAAKLLKITRKTFYNKIKLYNIN
jgi:two-component system response regulator HydG